MADVRVKVAEGKKLYWRGRDRTVGEIIEVPEKEARLIVALKKGSLVEGKATKVAEPQPVPATPELQNKVMTTESAADVAAPNSGPRRYSRRDMRASGE